MNRHFIAAEAVGMLAALLKRGMLQGKDKDTASEIVRRYDESFAADRAAQQTIRALREKAA